MTDQARIEQAAALKCTRQAPLSGGVIPLLLSELRNVLPDNMRATWSRVTRGARPLEFGEWCWMLVRLSPEQQLALVRGAIEGSALRVEIDDHCGEDLSPAAAQTVAMEMIQRLARCAQEPTAEELRAIGDELLSAAARLA